MLNMLNMLNRWGEMGPSTPKKFNIFNISPVLGILGKKYLTFPLFREILHFPCFVKVDSRNRGNVKCFSRKVLKTGEMLNMLNLWGSKDPISPHRFNIFNIFNIFNTSPVLSTFRKKHLTFPLLREGRLTKQGKC